MFVFALPLLIGCNGGTVDSAANPERLDLLSDLAQHVAVAGFQSVSDSLQHFGRFAVQEGDLIISPCELLR